MSLFQELKRRNVFRIGAAYAVAAWIILQITEGAGGIPAAQGAAFDPIDPGGAGP